MNVSHTKQKNSSKGTWEYAYEQIKERIFSMNIQPGEIVSENKLSQELGIGRSPIRMALKQLELDGLIVTANRRKRVFMLTIHEIEDIFDLKISIEGNIARWAAERGQSEEREQLEMLLQKMHSFLHEFPAGTVSIHERVADWIKLDDQFHDLLLQMANNKTAEQIVRNLNYKWYRQRIGILAIEGRIQTSAEEHENIGRAILRQDASGAEAATKKHIENLKQMIVTLMAAFHFPAT